MLEQTQSMLLVETGSSDLLVPEVPMRVRLATMDDVAFMDQLQKKYNRQLGFFPRGQLEGYVAGGWVLIAEDATTGERLGFCASRDRYLKRDELGIFYLLCVVPGVQRKFIGASLIKAVFERSAYGCRLYCCWCAQDIAANYFWESLGFLPIAFRAGSAGKKRVHIFWVRRINDGDTTTPYWYPFQTNSGAIRQDRLVFPIPQGVHWKDVKAVAMPTAGQDGPPMVDVKESKRIGGRQSLPPKRHGVTPSKPLNDPPLGKICIFVGGKLKYVDRPGYVAPAAAPVKKPCRVKVEKSPAPKFDPKFVSAARELRDRYLEQLNREPVFVSSAKHDVSRRMEEGKRPARLDTARIDDRVVRRLEAA